MTVMPTPSKKTNRLPRITAIIIAGLVVLAAVIFLIGSLGAPKTLGLTQTPSLTGTPQFIAQTIPGFKQQKNSGGIPVISYFKSPASKNSSCIASFYTGYLPAPATKNITDGDLSQTYLKTITGSIKVGTEPTPIDLITTTGAKLTFLQTSVKVASTGFTTTGGDSQATKMNFNTRFAVRAINQPVAHKTYTPLEPNTQKTTKTPPVLVAAYQCNNTNVSPKDWTAFLQLQRIKL